MHHYPEIPDHWNEHKIKTTLKSEKAADRFMELTATDVKELPYREISPNKIDCNFEGFNYSVLLSYNILK